MFPTIFKATIFIVLKAIMAISGTVAVIECNRSPVIVQKILLRDDIDSEVTKELQMIFTQFKVVKLFLLCFGGYLT
jgi:cytochrome bd-type quinol oxidase subunit 1